MVVCDAGKVLPAEVTVPHLVQMMVFMVEAVIVTKGPDTVPVGIALVITEVATVVLLAEVMVLSTMERVLIA